MEKYIYLFECEDGFDYFITEQEKLEYLPNGTIRIKLNPSGTVFNTLREKNAHQQTSQPTKADTELKNEGDETAEAKHVVTPELMCERCGFCAKNKSSLKSHLNRKTKCVKPGV